MTTPPLWPARRSRGQVLPMLAALLSVFGLVVVFIFNFSIFDTSAQIAMDGSLRNAGLAGLQQIDTSQGYARWYIDPVTGTSKTRSYLIDNLAGTTHGAGNFANLFADNLGATINLASGTSGLTVNGLDVEIINPAMESGQTSARFLNGSSVATTICNPGSFPEQVTSTLTGSCYDGASVVLRLRLSVVQATGPAAVTIRTIVAKAGTNG